jgi:hypothetical protein
MKNFSKMKLYLLLMVVSIYTKAQDVSINILNQPSIVSLGATNGRILIDICNNDGGSTITPLNKVRPKVILPEELAGNTTVAISSQGWDILSNNGHTVEFENTGYISPGECSRIILGYTGINIGGPIVVRGTIGFNGAPTQGNVTGNDLSTTSITISSTPLNIKSPALITALVNTLISGSSVIDLEPTGGSGSYQFNNATGDSTCIAPQGFPNLLTNSDFLINTDGSYSFTTPSLPGNYYFCVRVCDTQTPLPECQMTSYSVQVTNVPVCQAYAGVLD